ncbi:MAG: SAM-dependent methyltransferase [Propionibacteriales bacterium]|nr:SAM-dependent methyltransferase [Propionibacteriales bacterium]
MGEGEGWLTWREAWERALYGPDGFYRREQPADHFRTSAQVGEAYADVVLALLRREGLAAVLDVGAGAGELLRVLHHRDRRLSLTGVELRSRPADLPEAIAWVDELPASIEGLLLANEMLDNVPCDVVEVDDVGVVRLVEVLPSTGEERLGAKAPPEALSWLARWWPVDQPGRRAEVGLTRDVWWADACARLTSGVAVAVDYGHLRDTRPPVGSLTSYRAGRVCVASPDGRHDVTAHVAVDALSNVVGASFSTQRETVEALTSATPSPPIDLARTNPTSYLRDLSNAGDKAELTGSPGLGDFWWMTTRIPRLCRSTDHLSSSSGAQTWTEDHYHRRGDHER